MNSTSVSPKNSAGADERKLVTLICIWAAIHTFIFSAAFPFFNNIDEQFHFDLAIKYSQGNAPRSLEKLSVEATPYLVLYNSLLYLGTTELFPGGQFPAPPWTLPSDQFQDYMAQTRIIWLGMTNFEESQPPLYYSIAGAWWHVGKWLGLKNGMLLYWLRFLNVVLVMLLVWLGYVAARLIFPDRLFIRLGTPAILAFMPQTAFYSINNDILSPVSFGLLFLLLLRLLITDMPGIWLGIATGLALAATYLTKGGNLPLFVIALGVVLWKAWQLSRNGKWRQAWPSMTLLVICAGIPIGAWAAWLKYHFGDFTGSAAKIEHLGWTHKSFADWWSHPIFRPHGLWTFVSDLMSTFWQGEFWWHRQPMPSVTIGLIYTSLTMVLIAVALANLSPRNPAINPLQRQALWLSFGCIVAATTFLAWLSLLFDFGSCVYPSREHPYFTSGRLMLGVLIPFTLLLVFGLDCCLNKIKVARSKWLVLALISLLMLTGEIITDRAIFSSQYNWFHL